MKFTILFILPILCIVSCKTASTDSNKSEPKLSTKTTVKTKMKELYVGLDVFTSKDLLKEDFKYHGDLQTYKGVEAHTYVHKSMGFRIDIYWVKGITENITYTTGLFFNVPKDLRNEKHISRIQYNDKGVINVEEIPK